MTRIRMLGMQDKPLGFEVSGHAGAGFEGNDLVCAAISFLATTCVNALETVAGTKVGITQRDGYLKAELSAPHPDSKAETILLTFLQGARDLAETYPTHVKLIEVL